VDRYAFISDLYLSYGLDVMLVGERGAGKSSLVDNLLATRLHLTRLPVTSALNPPELQERVLVRMNAIEKRAGQRFSTKASSSKVVFFLDDIHLSSRGVLELTRLVATRHQLYNYSRNYVHSLNNVRLLSSCTPEGYWGLPIQLSRAFNPVPFIPLSHSGLKTIFSTSALPWLREFPDLNEEHELLAEVSCDNTVTNIVIS